MRARVLVAGVAVLALVASGCTATPDDVTPQPTPTVVMTDPPVPTQPELVYFPRASATGMRLGRELREVPQADPLVGVLEVMLAGPVDPDYTNGWAPGTRVLSATTSGDTTMVDLSEEARMTSLSPDAALAQVDQLIWTVTELVGADTKVGLTIEGERFDEVWGSATLADPRGRDLPIGARVLVSIDTPLDGATVRSPVVVVGDAAAHEAHLPWRILDDSGAVVQEGATTTEEGMRFAPYRFEVELPPGRYTVEVIEDGVSGEGFKPDVDTRQFTVEG